MVSRRSFLAAVPALTAIPWSTVLAAQPASANASFDPWVDVYTANLQWNVQAIARLVSGRPILAVIKNNGYGLGVANVARILEPLDRIVGFAVVKLQKPSPPRRWHQEADSVDGTGDEQDLEHAVRNRIQPMVYTPVGRALESLRRKTEGPIPIQICVDTGIGRVGVPTRRRRTRSRSRRPGPSASKAS